MESVWYRLAGYLQRTKQEQMVHEDPSLVQLQLLVKNYLTPIQNTQFDFKTRQSIFYGEFFKNGCSVGSVYVTESAEIQLVGFEKEPLTDQEKLDGIPETK